MLIGTKSDYLKIDKRDQNDPYSAFTIEAGIENSRSSFYGKNNAVMFSVDEKLKSDFKKFQDFSIKEMKIIMTEGCYLHLIREPHGNIIVKYRIGYWKPGSDTGIEGVARIDGEWSQSFLKELKKMILDS